MSLWSIAAIQKDTDSYLSLRKIISGASDKVFQISGLQLVAIPKK